MGNTKTSEVRDFIKFLVEQLTIFKVNENGYITNKSDELVKIDHNGEHSIMIYNDVITDKDALILNPMNETIVSTMNKENKFMYYSMSVGLAYRIILIIRNLYDYALAEVDNASVNKVDFISKYADKIDEKFLERFNRLSKDTVEFVNIYYNKKSRKAIFRSNVFEDKSLSKFRFPKKFIKVIKPVIMDILGMKKEKDLDNLKVKSESLKCPRLEAVLKLYAKIYKNLNPYIAIFDESLMVDVDELEEYISKLDEYYDTSRWLVNSSSVKSKKKTRRSSIFPQENRMKMFNSIPQKINNVPIIIDKPITGTFNSFNPYTNYNAGMLCGNSCGSPFNTDMNRPISFNDKKPIIL